MSLKNYPFHSMTFYILLERKFDAHQFLRKDLGLKMYGTEVVMSYNDVKVSISRNLSLLNIRIYGLLDKLFDASHIFPWKVNLIT